MAFLEGTLDEIYTYLGPRTSDIVTQLARKYRKNKSGNRNSCKVLKEDGTNCKKYTGLHAAHIKGRERKIIIQEILDEFAEKKTDSIFKMNLEDFEVEFRKKHENFDNTIQFMCPKHHKQYDNKKESLLILDEDEIEELVHFKENLDKQNLTFDELENIIKISSTTKIKEEFSKKFNINKSQISVSNVSETTGKWNFDINEEKFINDFVFIFIEKDKKSFRSALIKSQTLDLDKFPTKDDYKKRFIVEQNYVDNSGFDFNLFLNK